jgi:hypothetical protein
MLIYVDFRDKDLQPLIRLVDEQLQLFGLDPKRDAVPQDALACALDEVRRFASVEARLGILRRLEHYYARRVAAR